MHRHPDALFVIVEDPSGDRTNPHEGPSGRAGYLADPGGCLRGRCGHPANRGAGPLDPAGDLADLALGRPNHAPVYLAGCLVGLATYPSGRAGYLADPGGCLHGRCGHPANRGVSPGGRVACRGSLAGCHDDEGTGELRW